MVQNVKNQPAMGETWVQSLGWEDSLEKGTATHSSVMAWRVLWTEEPGRFTVHGVTKSWTRGDGAGIGGGGVRVVMVMGIGY